MIIVGSWLVIHDNRTTSMSEHNNYQVAPPTVITFPSSDQQQEQRIPSPAVEQRFTSMPPPYEAPSQVPPVSTTNIGGMERQYYWSHQPSVNPEPAPVIPQQSASRSSLFPSTHGAWIEPNGKQNTVHPALVTIVNFFLPGVGHLMIGQYNKALYYILAYFGLALVVGLLACIVIGFVFLPLVIVFWIVIMHDGYVMADRLYNGYPIMAGECATGIATIGVGAFEKTPVFTTNSSNVPDEWRERYYRMHQ